MILVFLALAAATAVFLVEAIRSGGSLVAIGLTLLAFAMLVPVGDALF